MKIGMCENGDTCLEFQSYTYELEDYRVSDYANQKVLVSTEWGNLVGAPIEREK